MRGNLRGVQGPSTVTKLSPADQQRRYGSQIEITSFRLSRREVQGATQACLEQEISLLNVRPPESWKAGSSE